MMRPDDASKESLLQELQALRERIGVLESAEAARRPGVAEAGQAEEELRESRTRLHTVLEAAPIGIGLLVDRVFQWVNRRMTEMTGYPPEELIGHSARALYESDHEFERVGEAKYDQIRRAGYGETDTRWRRKSGEKCDIHLQSRAIDRDNLRAGVIFTALDITERNRGRLLLQQARDELEDRVEKRTAELARANETLQREIAERKRAAEQLRLTQFAVEHVVDAAFWLKADGQIFYVNQSACRMLGYTRDELLSMKQYEIDVHRTAESWAESFRQIAQRGAAVVESELRSKSGELVPVEISGAYLEFGGEQYVIAFARDITERRRAAQAIQAEQRRLRRLLDMHERDRQLFAYEIHDGFVQTATGALMNLEALHARKSVDEAETSQAVELAGRLLRESIAEARRLMNGLRPPMLDEAGIVAALDHFASEVHADAGPAVGIRHAVSFTRLAAPLESAVFRIVQEAVGNARRHSRTDRIEVRLTQQEEDLHIVVEDWGTGFDPKAVKSDRFGLEGIRERARLFGGRAEIESASGHGTLVKVVLPIVRAASDPASTS